MGTNGPENSAHEESEGSSMSIDLSELVGLKPKVIMENTRCPHKNRKHYAKNMCSICYRKSGREAYAHACPHTEKRLYSKGMCQSCYLSSYHRNRFQLNEKPAPIFEITKTIKKMRSKI
jgi:hypothetical protein